MRLIIDFSAGMLAVGLLTAHPVSAQSPDTLALRTIPVKEVLMEEVRIHPVQDLPGRLLSERRASLQTPTDHLLEFMPGVQMVKRGNYAWEPTIRGLQAAQINITIDGMHIFGACTDRMDPVSSYIEPTNLRQISLHMGPGFGNYGGSIGGGVDFNLKAASFRETPTLHGMFGTGIESSAGGWQTLGSLNYSGPKFSLQANGIFRKASNYRSAGGEEVLFSQYQKWNGGLVAGYRINDRHTLQADYIRDEGSDIGYPALTMDVAFANAHIGSLTHVYERKEGGATTAGQKGLLGLRSKIYYNFIDHAMDDTQRPPEQVPIPMDMPGRSWTGGFFSEAQIGLPWNIPAGRQAVLQTRLSGYLNRLTADMTMYPAAGAPMYMFTLPDTERRQLYWDLSHELSLNERLSASINGTLTYSRSGLFSRAGELQLSGMLDGEDPDRHDLLWNLNAQMAYAVRPDWTVQARIGRSSRNASLQEYYAFYIFNRLDGYDFLGNHLLDTEKSLNLQLGTSYGGRWFRAELSLFGYLFDDYIAGRVVPDYQVMTIGAHGVKQYQNIGNARTYGGEVVWGVSLTPQVHLHSSSSYTRGEDNEGYALPMISPFQSVNGLHWEWKGYHLQADVQYDAPQNHVSTTRYGETPTPSSTLFHIGARKTFLTSRVVVTTALRVENIFDTYYYRHLDIMKIPRPGRTLNASITVGF